MRASTSKPLEALDFEGKHSEDGTVESPTGVAEPRSAGLSERLRQPLPMAAWILGGLVLVLYGPVLKALALDWWTDPDYGHGFLVPVFSAFVLWRQRDRWRALALEPRNVGLLVMTGALALLVLGSLGAELFTSRFSLIILLGGMVLFLAGWKAVRLAAFPLGFLIFMIPLPALIYNQVTLPLQFLASRFAVTVLQSLQVPALREGNLISLPNYTLEVVEACSGIRSLMSLLALAAAYAYLVDRRRSVRAGLLLAMIPVAIVSNGIRIVGTGLLTYHFGPATAEGFFHSFSGWLIFLCALLLMLVTYAVLRRLANAIERLKHG
jgi:exosortase